MPGLTNVEVGELSSAIAVLSAMITPAIMILASGSILGTVSTRLTRVVDRVRDLAAEIGRIERPAAADELMQARRDVLPVLLHSATRRARLLQRAMMQLYLAVGAFVLTSISIGVLSFTDADIGWIALGFGLIGAMLLLNASVYLIIESRMALSSIRTETAFVSKWGEHHLAGVREADL